MKLLPLILIFIYSCTTDFKLTGIMQGKLNQVKNDTLIMTGGKGEEIKYLYRNPYIIKSKLIVGDWYSIYYDSLGSPGKYYRSKLKHNQ